MAGVVLDLWRPTPWPGGRPQQRQGLLPGQPLRQNGCASRGCLPRNIITIPERETLNAQCLGMFEPLTCFIVIAGLCRTSTMRSHLLPTQLSLSGDSCICRLPGLVGLTMQSLGGPMVLQYLVFQLLMHIIGLLGVLTACWLKTFNQVHRVSQARQGILAVGYMLPTKTLTF